MANKKKAQNPNKKQEPAVVPKKTKKSGKKK